MNRRHFIKSSAVVSTAALGAPLLASDGMEAIAVAIDTKQALGPLPHVWEECAGSDRAAITLRETWRKDWVQGHKELGLKRVRFHGIFSDELGVYAPSWLNGTHVVPNFMEVFEVYDGLLACGVSPYVELSFMPKQLASGTGMFGFYNANTSPPKTLEAWADFITQFVKALIGRYGLAIVRTWPFEVWNEPNLRFFFTGTQQQYFDLYKVTALAIKAIDPQLQVGGPSTSAVQWIAEFAAWCGANNAPVDFFATHCYASDPQQPIFGPVARIPTADVIPAAVKKARMAIDASPFKGKPLYLSEWSSDSPAMIAHVIKGCLPNLQAMSHWVLSGTYEEIGVFDYILKEGNTGYAMMTHGIAKPSYNAYRLLHALGTEQMASEGPTLASRHPNGKVSALVWNLADVVQPSGIPGQDNRRVVHGEAKRLHIKIKGARAGAAVRVQFVDQERGSPMPAWRKMGSPKLPTQAQLATLRKAAILAPPVTMKLGSNATLTLDLPPEGLALIELG